MQHDPKHSLSIHQDNWFLRAYEWLYPADAENANFCKLAWGIIFLLPWLPIRLLVIPWAVPALIALDERLEERKRARDNRPLEDIRAERRARLEAIEAARDRKLARRAKIDRVLNWMQYSWFRFVLIGLGVLLTVGIVGGVIALFILFTNVMLRIVLTVVAIIALGAFFIALGAFFAWFFDSTEAGDKTATKIKDSAKDFVLIVKGSFKALKDNTCPEVIVRKD